MVQGFSLAGKIALVTGAASGIGIGIAEMLAEAGAFVVVADRDAAGAEAQAAKLREAGHQADFVTADLADEASIVGAFASVVAKHGAPWVVVNNAGIHDRELLLEGTVGHWDRIMDINARGVFVMMREGAKAMVVAGQGGRIVNVASAAVGIGFVKGGGAYTASKGAIFSLAAPAAYELAEHAITVNTVLPGGVATPGAANAKGPRPEGPGTRPPPFGLSQPRDIGAAVLFFASPAARQVTGQWITVDGGQSIS
jgi:NAD(P)-dependent dehydrogenase (short-subunit alcohol dehydrogenase family)